MDYKLDKKRIEEKRVKYMLENSPIVNSKGGVFEYWNEKLSEVEKGDVTDESDIELIKKMEEESRNEFVAQRNVYVENMQRYEGMIKYLEEKINESDIEASIDKVLSENSE